MINPYVEYIYTQARITRHVQIWMNNELGPVCVDEFGIFICGAAFVVVDVVRAVNSKPTENFSADSIR